MDNQKRVARIKNGTKILSWLAFLVFFAYSFQSIMDLDWIADPRRWKSFVRILTALSHPNLLDGAHNRAAAFKMWETIQMAFLATTISAVFAIPFTFVIARPSSFWSRGFNILLQPIVSAVRSVHPLITTISVVVLAGIGPTAGVPALTLISTAVLIVSFSEYAQQHTSLSWPTLFQNHFPALAFKHFPINLLIATVLGWSVGGGIGFLILQNIRLLDYSRAVVDIFACIITIGSLDLLARAVWYKIQDYRTSIPSTP